MAKVEPDLLSIGDICSETGLSADVVRVWERRYGFPSPVRLPSGHRRYRQEDLNRLRLMAEAVAQGHRPAGVARSTEAALKRLLVPEGHPAVDGLFQAVSALDTEGMRRLLREASIAQAARATGVGRVAVSLSILSSGETTRRLLRDLKERLPQGCRLLIGGQGAARTRRIEGVDRMAGLEVM